ncbi:type II toxin-antitoxin system PemK/MazF family toxin [Shewanella surugensis]|uniref:Type II toxin-antitoxin system PemK/MazF family toxin n=1 Tax=Shewanella surugensis TaxID=212020 RepID=A0ABT0LFH9_9GAMM|nr:type II toxin-antitoxin system PemK/MazF family toxin [Shewanella surugensis]MCL1126324.1 type II toxin-antitoxin system PemK/MazF family toxin [Shewanella surugensis]
MVKKYKRYDVVGINLDPTIGAECQKFRPCVVISPDDMNVALQTIIIAPLTSTRRGWKFRPLITGPNTQSELALDQMRAVDKSRITKTYGKLIKKEQDSVYSILTEFFI